jgi:hypothetical protein
MLEQKKKREQLNSRNGTHPIINTSLGVLLKYRSKCTHEEYEFSQTCA